MRPWLESSWNWGEIPTFNWSKHAIRPKKKIRKIQKIPNFRISIPLTIRGQRSKFDMNFPKSGRQRRKSKNITISSINFKQKGSDQGSNNQKTLKQRHKSFAMCIYLRMTNARDDPTWKRDDEMIQSKREMKQEGDGGREGDGERGGAQTWALYNQCTKYRISGSYRMGVFHIGYRI